MTCPAAINATSAKLAQPKTASQIFRELNWWVLPSVNEALLELKTAGEIEVVGVTNNEAVYQRRTQ